MDAADPAPPDAWWLRQLRAEFSAGERIRFQYFWGHRDTGRTDASCLSQWFPAPFSLDGQVYATAEHWMMAEKARLF
ncbi:MAG: NADAR family protein, partial [Xanthomonadales bacterium]|nr:NADAR family protein [Xanthomonadales bacterium]